MTLPQARDFYLDDLWVGQVVEKRHVITDADIHTFARLTGDYSPLHVDDEFAKASRFGKRLAHGLLTSSFITGIIGMELPARNGIYMGQTLNFRKPVFVDDEIVVRATVASIDHEKSRIRLATVCLARGEVAVDGEALIHIPKRARG